MSHPNDVLGRDRFADGPRIERLGDYLDVQPVDEEERGGNPWWVVAFFVVALVVWAAAIYGVASFVADLAELVG